MTTPSGLKLQHADSVIIVAREVEEVSLPSELRDVVSVEINPHVAAALDGEEGDGRFLTSYEHFSSFNSWTRAPG
jgi:hypothetical protein